MANKRRIKFNYEIVATASDGEIKTDEVEMIWADIVDDNTPQKLAEEAALNCFKSRYENFDYESIDIKITNLEDMGNLV